MQISLKKSNIPAITAFIALAMLHTHANAAETYKGAWKEAVSTTGGFYAGLFAGGGTTHHNNVNQTGTAFFSAAAGGPLAVNATGATDNNATGILGLQFGYEARNAMSPNPQAISLIPAAELEGYYLRVRQTAQLQNPTSRLPEHVFDDSFPMNTGVILANSVWIIKIPSMTRVDPYFGLGVGAATINISGAYSKQVAPYEAGVNHFNSNPNASDWVFAAQVKTGLRFLLNEHWRLFAEYRFLYLGASSFTFGSTQYPTHVATTNWNSNISNQDYNMGVAGVQYTFG